MGITGFWPLIAHLGEKKSLAEWSKDHLEKHKRPLRIAVDEAHWRYKGPSAEEVAEIVKNAPDAKVIERNILYRLWRLLKLGILPYLVFDGKDRPKEKHGSAGGNVDDVKELLESLHVPWHTAPGEAEAECAAMQSCGIVDAVWTEDSDAFMFGCSVVVRKTGDPEVVEIFRMERLEQRGFTCKEAVVLFAVLAGCDYTEGLWGCGPKEAKKVLQNKSVQTGGLLKEMWDVETGEVRTIWLDRLRDFLPVKMKGEVDDDEFATLEVLRNCLRPTVSEPDALASLEGKTKFRGYTSEELRETISFLKGNFNRKSKPTWPLEYLAPVQLVWSLLSKEPKARHIVAAFKRKNKARLTSPVQVDPLLAFRGLDDSSIRATLFDTTPVEIVDCEILDVILGHDISEENFEQWREENMKARAKKKPAQGQSSQNGEAAKTAISPEESIRIPDAPSRAVKKTVCRSRKRKAVDLSASSSVQSTLSLRTSKDKFWQLGNSFQESGLGAQANKRLHRSLTFGSHGAKHSAVVGTGDNANNPIVLD